MDKKKVAARLDKDTQLGIAPAYRPELGPCWVWTGYLAPNGYGMVSYGGKSWWVHRLAYAAFVGLIPDNRDIDHLCRVRNCINPQHLEPVTHRENVLRGATLPAANAAKTHCDAGHEFTEENTLYRARSPWQRDCRACQRKRNSEWQRANRSKK